VVRIDYVSYFSRVDREEITAYVDLSNIDSGDNMKIIEVELPSSAKLMGVDPGYLLVNVTKKEN